jgi:hypothetical protein
MRQMPLIRKNCETCQRLFEPWRHDQRWCCAECGAEGRAAEARSARELWRRQGRPVLDEPSITKRQRAVALSIVERFARVEDAVQAHEVPEQGEPLRRRL